MKENTADLLETLKQALESRRYDYEVRNAIKASAAAGNRGAVPHLIELLRHGDDWTVAAAAEALGILRDPLAIPALLEKRQYGLPWRILDDESCASGPKVVAAVTLLREAEDVRYQVIKALGAIGGADAGAALNDCQHDERETDQVRALARSLVLREHELNRNT